MCLCDQAPDEAAEPVNLSQKVSIAAPDETAAEEATEEDQPLPEWSEKVASGILTGEVKHNLLPKILLYAYIHVYIGKTRGC